ncbi:MAG: hypothetical protein K5745_01470 [Saccharofermentans sp.]|nr:hypothetical protein [Saccharofermentans sp.]
MKKCPVCGVMMGDNVARCSMCKYDFQKASQGNTDEATKEAQQVLERKEQENIARAEAKRTEEEKKILESIERLQREYDTLQDKFDSEKLKLDSEFSTIQKKKLDEKIALEQAVENIRADLDQARTKRDELREECATMEADSRAKSQKEHDDLIAQAQAEQERILGDARSQTEQLAIQVEKEYGEAMSKRDELLAQAKEAQEFIENFENIKKEKEAEIKDCEDKITKLNADFEAEKVRIAEESKKVSMEQATEALKIKDQAEKDRDKALAEKEQLIAQAEAEKQQIIAELEERNKKAQAELDTMTEQAKGVMAEAEEALSKRDAIKKEIDEFDKTSKAQQKELDELTKEKRKNLDELESKKTEAEAQLTEYYKQQETLQTDIDGLKGKLDEANRIIEDSKNATVLAEAAAQEIVLNAEKQSVFLKEAALRESDKGKMLAEIEEKDNKIKEIEMEKAELEKKLAALESSVAALEKKVKEGGGAVSVKSGPKDYSVEVIDHNSASEVDTKKLEKILDAKAKDGWTLVQIIDDDGGKLISSLGGSSESTSLSLGSAGFSSTKQDRLILIFERPLKK